MNGSATTLLIVYLLILTALAWPTGQWLAAVAEGRLPRGLRHIDTALLRMAGVDAEGDGGWRRYALALLLFNVLNS